MPGSVAANFKEGSRSEILADYLFSQWGAVTPARRQDDIGVDLYCTLLDRVGPLGVVREYFSVQVKSGIGPWIFDGSEEVKWFVEYPTPLFLACVDKTQLSVRIYHTMPRFALWALSSSSLPSRIVITPGDEDFCQDAGWLDGAEFLLRAPVLRVTLVDMMDREKMNTLRDVFQMWVASDRENCDLFRRGLLRFRMPLPYSVNQLPTSSIVEAGNAMPESRFLERGILTLAEDAECLGGQLYRKGDRAGALRALLLVHHLWKTYPALFDLIPRWKGSIPGDLGTLVVRALNEATTPGQTPPYLYQGIAELGDALDSNSAAARFLVARS